MLGFILKLQNIMLSEKYKYFDMFLSILGLLYCIYAYVINNNIEYLILCFSLLGFVFSYFDITRKINKKLLGG